MRSFIGLGSNLGKRKATIRSALQALQQHPNIALQACSSLYLSRPLGPRNQPDYINAVAQIRTRLSPFALLDALQRIEHAHGRERNLRWGARTLDLDILLYDGRQLHTRLLDIPHPQMQRRDFVLQPLAEISPELVLPDGQRLKDLLKQVPDNELTKLESINAFFVQDHGRHPKGDETTG